MPPVDHQLTASQVLHVFHRDEIYLFLGAAFTTVGLIAAAFLVMRRRFDALLFWLAVVAILYGNRLWMVSDLFSLMVPPSDFFNRLRASIDEVVAIPAFFFFIATGFMGRLGKIAAYLFSVLMLLLLLAIILGGPITPLRTANSVLVILALIVLLVQSFTTRVRGKDFAVVRTGVLIFAAFALWSNIQDIFQSRSRIEPFGFAALLCCLGYVAARRALERDQQLNEIQKELEVAKRIQLSILPAEFAASANFRVAARYVPMTAVAGDFYDFLVADDKQAGLLIADVSGHGVPAALIASMVKLAATSERANAAKPSELLSRMNTMLCGNTQKQFITAAYVHLDAIARELRYSAAGHPPMLLLRDGEVIAIEENGLMLAAFSSASYTDLTFPLEPGDRILLYTDGIIEAADARGDFLGHAGLCALFQKTAGLPPGESVDLIFSSVEKWAPLQDDDRTVLICDYVGTA
jgi:sigma-B regulation protein RsbU (phosphoserine phosphatase)